MARSINKAIVVGNLGQDPELRQTASGSAVTNFSVATNRQWTGSDGTKNEETEWHRIVAFGRLAEICNEYLRKGKKVYVEGRIQTRSWDDEKTGMKRYMTEIVAREMVILDPPGSSGRSFAPEPQAHPETDAGGGDKDFDMPDSDDFDDDLPF